MSATVWLCASTLTYPEGGGHMWAYLNWALGLRELGCRVVWLELHENEMSAPEVARLTEKLKQRLGAHGFSDDMLVASAENKGLPRASDADLLLNLSYGAPELIVRQFRRTALLDIDPGLLQVWVSEGVIEMARHDFYFTTGETVGQPGAKFPDAGLKWHHTTPCVALSHWHKVSAASDAPFTTVSHWSSSQEWVTFGSDCFHNDKRSGFEPFLDLPKLTKQPLELALCLAADEKGEREMLERKGWRVKHSHKVAGTPADYQGYIRQSRGEFTCVKPSCVRLQNAWIGDRTICYLGSGKPAIVQHTGASRFLPDAAGLFRFRTVEEAAHHLDAAATDYENQCRLARALAEEFFDAKKTAARVLEIALN